VVFCCNLVISSEMKSLYVMNGAAVCNVEHKIMLSQHVVCNSSHVLYAYSAPV